MRVVATFRSYCLGWRGIPVVEVSYVELHNCDSLLRVLVTSAGCTHHIIFGVGHRHVFVQVTLLGSKCSDLKGSENMVWHGQIRVGASKGAVAVDGKVNEGLALPNNFDWRISSLKFSSRRNGFPALHQGVIIGANAIAGYLKHSATTKSTAVALAMGKGQQQHNP